MNSMPETNALIRQSGEFANENGYFKRKCVRKFDSKISREDVNEYGTMEVIIKKNRGWLLKQG